jgi:hypothetical protein
MKALSLTQPYATLIALGYKRNETRGFATKHRGPLLIHASATRAKWAREACETPIIKALLERHGLTYNTLPRGVILCSSQLLEVALITEDEQPADKIYLDKNGLYLSETEEACGDYTPGRFAWLLSNVEVLPEPVPAKGQLTLWNATPALQEYAAGLLSPYQQQLLSDITADPFGMFTCLHLNPSPAAAGALERLLQLQLIVQHDEGRGISYQPGPGARFYALS